jgi:arsenate reductase
MPASPAVLFVCLHGSAKSFIAARHFERMAAARGLRAQARSAGLEPDSVVPPHVIAGLAADGIDVLPATPAMATAALAKDVSQVVAFGCDVSAVGIERDVIQWTDVPAVSDGYGPARDAIVVRLHALLEKLAPT